MQHIPATPLGQALAAIIELLIAALAEHAAEHPLLARGCRATIRQLEDLVRRFDALAAECQATRHRPTRRRQPPRRTPAPEPRPAARSPARARAQAAHTPRATGPPRAPPSRAQKPRKLPRAPPGREPPVRTRLTP